MRYTVQVNVDGEWQDVASPDASQSIDSFRMWTEYAGGKPTRLLNSQGDVVFNSTNWK